MEKMKLAIPFLLLKIAGALIIGGWASLMALIFLSLDKPSNVGWLDQAIPFSVVFSLSGLYVGYLFPRTWYVTALIAWAGFSLLYTPVSLLAGYLGSRVNIALAWLKTTRLRHLGYTMQFALGVAPPLLLLYWFYIGQIEERLIVGAGDSPYMMAAPDELQAAVEKGNLQEIERLVLMGHGINTIDLAGRTPLHYAVAAEQDKAVQLLLSHGADPDIKDLEFGVTPLHWAVGSENFAIVQLLVPRMKNIDARNKFDKSAADIARDNASKEIVEYLTAHGSTSEFSLD